MTHALKTWPEFYAKVASGEKQFELRKDDRDYKSGDTVILQEFDNQAQRYTGKESTFEICYVLRDAFPFGLKKGFVIFSLKEKNY